MDTLFIILGVLGMGAFVALFNNYNDLDNTLFNKEDDKNYKPFGLAAPSIGVASGVIITFLSLFNSIFGTNMDMGLIYAFSISMLGLGIALSVFVSAMRMKTLGAIVRKSLFLIVLTVLGYVIGIIGAAASLMILIAAAAIYMIVSGTRDSITGTGESYTGTDSNGKRVKLKSSMLGNFEGSDGRTYRREGNKFYHD